MRPEFDQSGQLLHHVNQVIQREGIPLGKRVQTTMRRRWEWHLSAETARLRKNYLGPTMSGQGSRKESRLGSNRDLFSRGPPILSDPKAGVVWAWFQWYELERRQMMFATYGSCASSK